LKDARLEELPQSSKIKPNGKHLRKCKQEGHVNFALMSTVHNSFESRNYDKSEAYDQGKGP